MNIVVEGNSLSRLYYHLSDSTQFMIIGSNDKDTHIDQHKKLLSDIWNLMGKEVYQRQKSKMSYKSLEGKYTYENGESELEYSYIVYNISKPDAVRLMKEYNQESIIWKDENFFGFIYYDGREDDCFSRSKFNVDDLSNYASRLISKQMDMIILMFFL